MIIFPEKRTKIRSCYNQKFKIDTGNCTPTTFIKKNTMSTEYTTLIMAILKTDAAFTAAIKRLVKIIVPRTNGALGIKIYIYKYNSPNTKNGAYNDFNVCLISTLVDFIFGI